MMIEANDYVRPIDNFTVGGVGLLVGLLLVNKWYFIRDTNDEQVLLVNEVDGRSSSQWIDKDFVESHCDVAKEVDGYKWIWDGLWRLENNKYWEVHHDNTDEMWVLNCNPYLESSINPTMNTQHSKNLFLLLTRGKQLDMLELGVKLFKEWKDEQFKKQRDSILNRMTNMMEIANELNNERYIEMLDFIYTDLHNNRKGGLTENEIVLLNEINNKMVAMV